MSNKMQEIYDSKQTVWLDLTLVTYGRGRSAVDFDVTDFYQNKYWFRLKEFYNTIKNVTVIGGKFSGNFKVVKQGCSFSLSLVLPDNE